MHKEERPQKRKLLLALSICINLGLLLYFKYSNFFIENVNTALDSMGFESIEWVAVVLPIGISFFTFETLTYSIDAYRKVITPLNKITDYYLYILLFPKLIAGPIVRFNLIEDQITTRTIAPDDRLIGFYRFAIGLGKKVLIANIVGAEADRIFALNPMDLNTSTAWIGILAYTFQIYFDFSGYSDMAIGIGKMIGFRFPENFNNPYTSTSISEFWRRWHMTLGMWMKEYLYIPLGGNKVRSKARLFLNLWIVFLISGLWHGASWNFVLWGAFHGTFLILDRLFLLKFLERIGKVLSTIITFIIVMIGWVLFRVEDLKSAGLFYEKLFSFEFSPLDIQGNPKFYTLLIIAFIFSFFTSIPKGEVIQQRIYFAPYTLKRSFVMGFASILIFILSIAFITSTGFNPFIYFRF
jgi:alginate O-acetyltransferase complex protein AlgI